MSPSSRKAWSRGLSGGLVLACAVLAAGCDGSGPWRAKVEETQVIELMAVDIEKLFVVTDNGHIHVAPATASDTVRVSATITATGRTQEEAERTLELVEILTPRTGAKETTQEVRWNWKDRRHLSGKATVSFDIEMPATMQLAATTDNGEIEIVGVTAPRILESDNGRIVVSDWSAADEPLWDGSLQATDSSISAKTDNGEIDLRSAAGALSLSVDNGQINVRSAARRIKFVTSNGAIHARLTASGRLDGTIRSDNGAVNLVLNPDVSVRLDCNTDNGGVAHEFLTFNESSSASTRNRLKSAIGAGEGLLEIETDNGSIHLEGMPRPGNAAR